MDGVSRWFLDALLMEYGLTGLLLVSFLAATVLPLGSEWLLVALLLRGLSPPTIVGVATLGNTLGAVTTWAVGRWGGAWISQRLLRMDAAAEICARRWYQRYGIWSLLLAWLPVVGDPICLVAGVLGAPLGRFVALAGVGKAIRYGAVAWITLGIRTL